MLDEAQNGIVTSGTVLTWQRRANSPFANLDLDAIKPSATESS